jgi:UDP-glucose 4-epimerase
MKLMDEPRAEGEVFNVGSMEEVSILDVAERAIAATGSSSQISCLPYEEAYERGFEDMRRRVPDISKIEDLVGWRPSRTLDVIIAEVVQEAKAHRKEQG